MRLSRVDRVSGIGRWWDGVELWIIGLPFIPQVLVVLAVLIPVAVLVARLLDPLVGGMLRLLAARPRTATRTDTAAAATVETED